MTAETERRLHLFVKQARFAKKAASLSFELRPELHAIVAREVEQGEEFVRSASGMSAPKGGRILLGAAEPCKAPELRARIGSLLRNEPPLAAENGTARAATVREYLAYILALRHSASGGSASGGSASGNSSSGNIGSPPETQTVPFVADLLDRPSDTLNNQERRLVALGLALSIAQPLLLVLHDPLFELGSDIAASLLEKLGDCVKSGAIIACLVPTERAARQLSERIHRLEPAMITDTENHFLIRSERPREVASSLARSRNILSTKIRPSGDLIVSATSEESAAADITAALAAAQVEVFEVRRVSSPEVQSGT